MMKKNLLYILSFFLFSLSYSYRDIKAMDLDPGIKNCMIPRDTINLNSGWNFRYGDYDTPISLEYDDSKWQTVDLPHDFQIHQDWVEPSPEEKPDLENPMANIKSRLSARGFKEMGVGWYRKRFIPSERLKGRRILLDFEGILLNGDVYLNGERIGRTDYGYLGFEIDITDKLIIGKENVITVKASTGQPENSRWYTGAGLYRDVNLISTDNSQFFTRHSIFITTPEVSESKTLIAVKGEIATLVKTDSINVGIKILSPDGVVVYDKITSHWVHPRQNIREFSLDSIRLSDVCLWDCDNPFLYTVETTLFRPDGTIADQARKRFGIRKIEYSPEFGFKLNGKKTLLKGIANHHTLGALGAAAYPKAIEKRIKLLKDFGFNHIRTSHNPYSESFLDLCDEYGILVVDELYDKWTKQYVGGRSDWSARWQKDIPEWIKRDRNHPSVIMWSLGNELQLIPDMPYGDWGITPYKLQKSLLQRYDTSRPVTVAMHPRGRNEHTDSLPAPLALETDIAAYNYRYMYFPGDSKRYPWMIFYQSEANTSNMGPNYFEMDLDKVVGLAYWGMIDYLGESNGWPAKGWTQGVFDISLHPKPMAYFLKSYFKPEEPTVFIAPFETTSTHEWNGVTMGGRKFKDSWNFSMGDSIDLYTFTNADEVELILNGKSLGRKINNISNPRERNRIVWENIPYEKGKIEAKAFKNGIGNPIASHILQTHSDYSQLLLSTDNPTWKADGKDLQHVSVEAVDRNGVTDTDASRSLAFYVDGPAEIVGVINGDMNSEELTVGNTRRLYEGRAMVILRNKGIPGKVTLTVSDGKNTISQKLQVVE